ncbi:hypothetical protein CANCADRAFT_3990 [Tortispora caseinolytica NRRL Y-17796]|uniref:Uncharacterized protein n=1 Tax=Tortispora caseinolytica NRRL Y-17796 TaxID=767744 RepID=A0A1E4TCC4_9ASCO|nr:hypothetical protein CANCADRAFT_3990 [Tortispora caseinolytica NRRL Y-17796]
MPVTALVHFDQADRILFSTLFSKLHGRSPVNAYKDDFEYRAYRAPASTAESAPLAILSFRSDPARVYLTAEGFCTSLDDTFTQILQHYIGPQLTLRSTLKAEGTTFEFNDLTITLLSVSQRTMFRCLVCAVSCPGTEYTDNASVASLQARITLECSTIFGEHPHIIDPVVATNPELPYPWPESHVLVELAQRYADILHKANQK